MCPISNKLTTPISKMVGHVASIKSTDSATTNIENAIEVKSSLLVFNLKYAIIAINEMKTARVIPPMCNPIWTTWNPWKIWGTIIGIDKEPITTKSTIPNRVDFLSRILSILAIHKIYILRKFNGSGTSIENILKKRKKDYF